jgi:hypothetical protein
MRYSLRCSFHIVSPLFCGLFHRSGVCSRPLRFSISLGHPYGLVALDPLAFRPLWVGLEVSRYDHFTACFVWLEISGPR